MARPTKLNPDAAERIVNAVGVGATLDVAASVGGITYKTLRRWLDRGQKAKSGEYAAFYKTVTEAQARLTTKLLAIVDKAAQQGDWRAASWKLAHLYPEQFGGTQVELTGKGGKPIQHQVQAEAKSNLDPVQHAAEILQVLKEVGVLDEVIGNDAAKKEATDAASGADPGQN